MKRSMMPVVIAMFLIAPVLVNAQESNYSLAMEKKDLHNEKKGIRKEEKLERKDKRATERTEVSYFTEQAFRRDFPAAENIGYKVGSNFDEVMYRLENKDYIAYYDLDGELVGTTTQSQFSDIPEAAQKEINKRYLNNGYSLDRVLLFDDNEANESDMWLYERPFADMDNYFVELSKENKKLILQVDLRGNVSFFKEIR